MKQTHQDIINLLTDYLEAYPDQRFSQALFNLNINQFKNVKEPANADFSLRDIYADSDEKILVRMMNSLEILLS